ncbi:MAG: hypothetical protein RR376_28655, partial [Janthinobacterium sp.]
MTYTAAENRYDSIPYRRVGRSGLVLPLVDALAQPPALSGGASLPLAQQGAASAQLTRGLRAALQSASAPLQWGQVLLASVGTLAP